MSQPSIQIVQKQVCDAIRTISIRTHQDAYELATFLRRQAGWIEEQMRAREEQERAR